MLHKSMDLSLLTHHNDQLLGCVCRKSHDTHPQVGGLSCANTRQTSVEGVSGQDGDSPPGSKSDGRRRSREGSIIDM